MSSDGNTKEEFDEEEIADGFDEEIIGEEDLDDLRIDARRRVVVEVAESIKRSRARRLSCLVAASECSRET